MFKSYWYVCHNCDASIEVVSKGIHFQDPTCNCDKSNVVWCQTSVVESDPNQAKEEKMQTATYDSSSQTSMAENYNNNATMIVKDTRQSEMIYTSVTPYDVNLLMTDNQYQQQRLTKLNGMIDEIANNLTEDGWFNPNYDKDEALFELCKILNFNPVKTVEFSGSIRFEGSIDIPLDELADFDLQDHLQENLTLDSYSGQIVIDNYEVDYVNEGY